MLRKVYFFVFSLFLASCAVLPPQVDSLDTQKYNVAAPIAEFFAANTNSTFSSNSSLSATAPEITATVTQTGTLTATATIAPTPTVQPSYDYIIQKGTPLGMQDFFHTDTTCGWMGVGGQVFSKSGTPINNLIVEVQGTFEGKEVLVLALTGSAQEVGPGGYEIAIADHVAASSDELRLQLFDLSGNPLSEQYSFSTYDSCDQNLIMINFSQISGADDNLNYLPFIRK